MREAPADGRANRAIARALASALELPTAQVELQRGARGRRKRFRLTGDPDRLRERLAALSGPETDEV